MESYLETGKVSINKFHEPVGEAISDGFAEVLALYDQAEEASGLSQASLIKNRRPIRYLLEYMTSLGYQELSDIQHGDTIKAIEDMLDKHYDPTSLVTAISGMRRFYEMFPEIRQFRLEIPSRMPRKRSIIDVYSEEDRRRLPLFYLLLAYLVGTRRSVCFPLKLGCAVLISVISDSETLTGSIMSSTSSSPKHRDL